jgi:hypothetical protein
MTQIWSPQSEGNQAMTQTPSATAVIPMIDAIHGCVSSIPARAQKVAGYVTGSSDIQWTAQDWARFATTAKVRINQMPGTNPLLGDVLDVEDGAWTNEEAAQACKERKQHGLQINLYSSQGNLTALLNACDSAGVTAGNLWVANYSLSEAEATAMVVHRSGPWPVQAVQWAAPQSNPDTRIPGSNLTLAEGNCDLSVTAAGWMSG